MRSGRGCSRCSAGWSRRRRMRRCWRGLAGLRGDATPLGQALAGLAAAAAARTTPTAVAREYFALFIGVGRGELLPYASYYLTGFLHERPLAELRGTLAGLGIARAAGVAEPEDHLGFCCEVMAGLLEGRFAGRAGGGFLRPPPGALGRALLRRHGRSRGGGLLPGGRRAGPHRHRDRTGRRGFAGMTHTREEQPMTEKTGAERRGFLRALGLGAAAAAAAPPRRPWRSGPMPCPPGRPQGERGPAARRALPGQRAREDLLPHQPLRDVRPPPC